MVGGAITERDGGEFLMADYLTTDTELASVANAIRTKGGTSSPLVYPAGFVSAIEAIPTGGGNLQAKTNINPTTSSQTITPDTGYDGLSSVQINAMPSGSATTPATTITANPTISVSNSGLITATNSKTQSVTPTVSAGYVSSGTAGTITVNGSNTSQLSTQAAQTITPTTTNQTIASGKYLTGAQTIKGDANLVAGNIKSGTSIFGVVGTYSGGGGSNIKHSIFEWDDNYGCFVYSSGDIITRDEFASVGCSAVGMAIDDNVDYCYIAYFDGDPGVCVSYLNNQSVIVYDDDYSEDNNGMLLSEAGLPFINGVIHIFVY